MTTHHIYTVTRAHTHVYTLVAEVALRGTISSSGAIAIHTYTHAPVAMPLAAVWFSIQFSILLKATHLSLSSAVVMEAV